jgi:hypothetical protein
MYAPFQIKENLKVLVTEKAKGWEEKNGKQKLTLETKVAPMKKTGAPMAQIKGPFGCAGTFQDLFQLMKVYINLWSNPTRNYSKPSFRGKRTQPKFNCPHEMLLLI